MEVESVPPAATHRPGRDRGGDAVWYSFSCLESEERFSVERFEAEEELGRPYQIELCVTAEAEETDILELLGRDAQLGLERGAHRRDFAGLIVSAVVQDEASVRQRGVLTIRPALSALRLTTNTRIFQDKTARQILEEVLVPGLSAYRRDVDFTALDGVELARRDYCVQYRETDFDFAHRLMEEEGIGYFFEHLERERMCLFATSGHLPPVVTVDGGPVRFDEMGRNVVEAEPVIRFRPRVELTSTGTTLRDHDWTRARPAVERAAIESEGLRTRERAHEVYEHEHPVTISEDRELLASLMSVLVHAALPHGMPTGLNRLGLDLVGPLLGAFTSEDSAHRARIALERLRRDARTAQGTGVVTGFAPGLRFELIGHPTLGADGHYLLTSVQHTSRSPGSEGGDASAEYHNRFECIPLEVPWRPTRQSAKPHIHSVQTARVTGPLGSDVHTDQHGRIKVKFNWDRREDVLSGDHTCWIRVSQIWAGEGSPGFVFIPRVGMEVVVAFVDGDPDRPLVTGCVYNGGHPTPGLLPIEATKSILRTRTVPHGTGYNELSFEDAMGAERVHLRAQRDLDELVLNDHTTLVHGCSRLEIGEDRAEHVGGSQQSSVDGQRSVITHGNVHAHVSGSERSVVLGSAASRVGRSQTITVDHGSRIVNVSEGEHVMISGGRTVLSQGGANHLVLHTSDGGAEDPKGAHLETSHTITLSAGEAKITMNADGSGGIRIESPTEIELVVGGSRLVLSPALIQANAKTFPA